VTIEIPDEVSAKLDQFFQQYNLLETYDTQAKQIDHIVDKFNNAFINANSTLIGNGSDFGCNTVLNRNLTIIIKEQVSSGWVSADNWNTISFRIGVGTSAGLLGRTDTVVGTVLINIMSNFLYGMTEQ
jgi:hypothetical protein